MIFNKDSLERLRQSIDLVDVIGQHIELKRLGAVYKARCPFHNEKTPSFSVKKGDRHYHCFGCGAHGDAIKFLIDYQNLSFVNAIEWLANRSGVVLELADSNDKSSNRMLLKDIMNFFGDFFHFYLLHSLEAESARRYLYARGINTDCIRRFKIGFASNSNENLLALAKRKKFSLEHLKEVGLINSKGFSFFRDRILFPIHSSINNIIGFSARKYKESTFGGKYINSIETPLFKKSYVLFGLNFSKQRIAKERHAIIVEGQIDCLSMIESGFNITVSTLGTAFCKEHVKELLRIGVKKITLLLDSDVAGKNAAIKAGDIILSFGIETMVAILPEGLDPDSFLLKHSANDMLKLLTSADDFLSFKVKHLSTNHNFNSPTEKSDIIQQMVSSIRECQDQFFVHESLKKLSTIMKIPENMLYENPVTLIKSPTTTEPYKLNSIDPNRVLECDLLRWLVMEDNDELKLFEIANENLHVDLFLTKSCKELFAAYMYAKNNNLPADILSLAMEISDQSLLDDLCIKKIDKENVKKYFHEIIKKILDRHWMYKRELIKQKICEGNCSEEELLELAKEFEEIKKNIPIIKKPL